MLFTNFVISKSIMALDYASILASISNVDTTNQTVCALTTGSLSLKAICKLNFLINAFLPELR